MPRLAVHARDLFFFLFLFFLPAFCNGSVYLRGCLNRYPSYGMRYRVPRREQKQNRDKHFVYGLKEVRVSPIGLFSKRDEWRRKLRHPV